MRGFLVQVLLVLLAASAMGVSGRADLIYTRDGRVYEGEIKEEDTTFLTVVLPVGQVQIPRSSVVRIEKKPSATPTPIPTSTPRPTNTRVPTSTPLDTPTPSPPPTRAPAPSPTLVATLLSSYPSEDAEKLIAKYEKVQVPKAKYVLAYYSKGLDAMAQDKRTAAIKYWTDALKVNALLFSGPAAAGEDSGETPLLETRFEAALETLRLEAKRDPAAAAVMNAPSQRALRDINLLLSWIDRQFNLHLQLARLYRKMQSTENLAVEHYLKAHRLLSEQRRRYQSQAEEATAQGDPFNLRGLFFVPRTEMDGLLIDSRLAEIEWTLEQEFDLQLDDYSYDHE